MKRKLSIVFVAVVICSLFLATYAGPIKAFSSAVQQIFSGSIDSTIDGKWTSDDEWDDGMTSALTGGGVTRGIFRDKYFFVSFDPFLIVDEYLVEAFTDKTNDAGDYSQVIYCTASNGGAAPQSDDIRIDYVGHNGTIRVYVGTGTGWGPGSLGTKQVAQLLSISKLNGSNPHYTTEFRLDKTEIGAVQNNYIMVAFYDASNAAAGPQTWPPGANMNVPDTWGLNDASALSAIPESLGIGTTVILASVAVLVGFVCLRKLPKPKL